LPFLLDEMGKHLALSFLLAIYSKDKTMKIEIEPNSYTVSGLIHESLIDLAISAEAAKMEALWIEKPLAK
jgi:hypothetical protein